MRANHHTPPMRRACAPDIAATGVAAPAATVGTPGQCKRQSSDGCPATGSLREREPRQTTMKHAVVARVRRSRRLPTATNVNGQSCCRERTPAHHCDDRPHRRLPRTPSSPFIEVHRSRIAARVHALPTRSSGGRSNGHIFVEGRGWGVARERSHRRNQRESGASADVPRTGTSLAPSRNTRARLRIGAHPGRRLPFAPRVPRAPRRTTALPPDANLLRAYT